MVIILLVRFINYYKAKTKGYMKKKNENALGIVIKQSQVEGQ